METRDSVLVFAKKTGEYLTASNGETVVEKRKRKKVEKTGKSGNKLFSFAVWEAILEAVKSKYGEDGFCCGSKPMPKSNSMELLSQRNCLVSLVLWERMIYA